MKKNSEKLKYEELSIDHDDDEYNYNEFSQFLEEHTKRQKNKTASEIINMGEDFLSEIDHKKQIKQQEKKPYINYIIKKTNKYSEKYLLELDYNDVLDIYEEIKYQNRSIFRKFIEFFGLV
jgi:hypothetical protein